jgi:hypothetical protein
MSRQYYRDRVGNYSYKRVRIRGGRAGRAVGSTRRDAARFTEFHIGE